jgi:hypothetical protein
MSYINDRKQEILDDKRKWTAKSDANSDFDVFFTQIVKPLRLLRDAGMFVKLQEVNTPTGRGYQISEVWIEGAINFDFPKVD